jgi:hypothetical protein
VALEAGARGKWPAGHKTQKKFNNMAFIRVGVLYMLGADRGDHQSGKKDSVAESHDTDAA